MGRHADIDPELLRDCKDIRDSFDIAWTTCHITGTEFLHAQVTGRLPVPVCTNNYGWHVKIYARDTNDPLSFGVKATFSCEVRDLWSHPCPGHWVEIGRSVVYYARAAHVFSAWIKCRHCTCRCIGTLTQRTVHAYMYSNWLNHSKKRPTNIKSKTPPKEFER